MSLWKVSSRSLPLACVFSGEFVCGEITMILSVQVNRLLMHASHWNNNLQRYFDCVQPVKKLAKHRVPFASCVRASTEA